MAELRSHGESREVNIQRRIRTDDASRSRLVCHSVAPPYIVFGTMRANGKLIWKLLPWIRVSLLFSPRKLKTKSWKRDRFREWLQQLEEQGQCANQVLFSRVLHHHPFRNCWHEKMKTFWNSLTSDRFPNFVAELLRCVNLAKANEEEAEEKIRFRNVPWNAECEDEYLRMWQAFRSNNNATFMDQEVGNYS